ncbi:MAG: ABC-F family ATP-binding cassette domain-containing protein [Candidatus Magasanikbacteria bacterium]|jgi:ATP-binding cassette, subfamily F, member 3|nr:ABC-F family ATP-binding cassette domain-containing protein [Candidatus Magasanikbacteria bacterium]MBT4071160.1 ABC-F family ATP-binding cassette domain-containing protein [Candidatus Magasanikbacteria bacterium]
MSLLQIENISKEYSGQCIFDRANFVVNKKQKVAVIGRNGAGKSTLFHLINKKESLDSGRIYIHEHTHIGYVAQNDPFTGDEIVIDFLMEHTGKPQWKCAQMAARFDIKNDMLEKIISSFSGGYQMRIKLIAMLLFEPNILLLDEPTNYLDLSTQLLLEYFLQDYNGAFLLISHDREFLKRTCRQTLEIERGKLNYYPRPIEEYFAYKKEQHEWQLRYNKKQEREKRHLQDFVDRFRAKATKASQAQSKMKQIEKINTIEIVDPLKTASIHIPNVVQRDGIALSVENLSIGYGEKILAQDISFDIQKGEHIAIVGDNGQGKTTFLRTLVGEIPALTGKFTWRRGLEIAYYAQHLQEMLDPRETVEKYLAYMAHMDVSDEDILRMASNFLFDADGLKKNISVLSGGEKSRLCLAGLFLQKKDILLLDEPTNHLDFETVESLARALEKTNMTVIFISHNRTFVSLLADGIIEVKNGKIKRYLHDYDNYVYHLRQEIQEQKEPVHEKKEKVHMPEEEKQDKKEVEKKQKEIEESIGKYNRQRDRLLQWFEKNHDKHNMKKILDLQKVEDKISALEEEWMGL